MLETHPAMVNGKWEMENRSVQWPFPFTIFHFPFQGRHFSAAS